jgi:hypothetical protein
MAIVPSLLYRGTLTNANATLKTTDAAATTIVTSIVATNKTATAGWFTVTVNGFYLAYQMPVAANQTITIDVKQVTGTNVNIQGLANANSTIDLSISGAVSTGPSDQAWTSYTPAFTASITNPTNWTASGRYTQMGKLVVAKFTIVAGAGVTAGSGVYQFGLPVNAAQTIAMGSFSGYCYDSSAGTLATMSYMEPSVSSGAKGEIRYGAAYPSGALLAVASNQPFTWAQGDIITGHVVYEAA